MSELEESDKSKLGYVIIVVAVLAGVAAIGAAGYISGAGWFGYRQIMYGDGEIYLLNMGDKPLEVSVEGRESVEVDAQGARTVEVVGGKSQVVVKNAAGDIVERHTVVVDHSDALLKLTKDGCLAVSNIGAFYGRGGEGLEFVEMIEADEQLFVPGSTNVIWPRQTFPAKLPREGGEAMWVELVGCSLLEQEEFLRAYLDVQLGQRLKKARGGGK